MPRPSSLSALSPLPPAARVAAGRELWRRLLTLPLPEDEQRESDPSPPAEIGADEEAA
jgi:hypothetical protein